MAVNLQLVTLVSSQVCQVDGQDQSLETQWVINIRCQMQVLTFHFGTVPSVHYCSIQASWPCGFQKLFCLCAPSLHRSMVQLVFQPLRYPPSPTDMHACFNLTLIFGLLRPLYPSCLGFAFVYMFVFPQRKPEIACYKMGNKCDLIMPIQLSPKHFAHQQLCRKY